MYHIEIYSDQYFQRWNDFVRDSNNGTIFHRLDFLKYHGDRFLHNEQHLLFLKGKELFAILPLGVLDLDGKKMARSPIGASYGGILFNAPPSYAEATALIALLVEFLRSNRISEVSLTLPLQIFHRTYSETFMFAMLEGGFTVSNADISSVVDLSHNNMDMDLFSSRVRRMAKKAVKEGVTTRLKQPVDVFWQVLEKTFAKHEVKPTHSLEEWRWLNSHFPDSIWCDVAYLGDLPVAGIGHIKLNSRVDSSFYICQDPEYQSTQALTLLIADALHDSKTAGARYFDFGTSSVNMVARRNIFEFKEGFGAAGYFRHTLKRKLD